MKYSTFRLLIKGDSKFLAVRDSGVGIFHYLYRGTILGLMETEMGLQDSMQLAHIFTLSNFGYASVVYLVIFKIIKNLQ
jgi:hypothetical protein